MASITSHIGQSAAVRVTPNTAVNEVTIGSMKEKAHKPATSNHIVAIV